MNISSGFKICMERYGVSVVMIAKRRGISCRAVSEEIGSGYVKKFDTVASYCDTIGCSVEELMQEAKLAAENKKVLQNFCS